ncbi:VOC family protein [Sediminihabitans luteus]|nr:VOC family protein [Sediminihabitans luteus]
MNALRDLAAAHRRPEDVMALQIFVNLPVRDLDASKAFYEALGFTINPQFTDENAACVVLSDTVYAMLLTHDFFASFTPAPRPAEGTVGALYALSFDSTDEVDAIVAKALAAGGTATKETGLDGPMYEGGFADPDGHHWEPFFMDVSQF